MILFKALMCHGYHIPGSIDKLRRSCSDLICGQGQVNRIPLYFYRIDIGTALVGSLRLTTGKVNLPVM